jgi:hypothetical protein
MTIVQDSPLDDLAMVKNGCSTVTKSMALACLGLVHFAIFLT